MALWKVSLYAVKHRSEWAFKVGHGIFTWLAAEIEKYNQSKKTEELRSDGLYKAENIRRINDKLSSLEMEKERVNNLEWMDSLPLTDSKKGIWHFYPIFHDESMELKWLIVPFGQLTFDSEGDDNEGNRNTFTRKVHLLQKNRGFIEQSGITMGRGLDIGNCSFSKAELKQLFTDIELNSKLKDWLLGGYGKRKNEALAHYKTKELAGLTKFELTITRKQQHLIFL
eukprot:TRINITY_DN14089_c0_g1_i1.p1 TRINITY_DN14089_c0_g1~~TRINITY_DN14089_c0_g1_i1.p1  ORF type:complete len:226 (-),score=0.67 TRINITY_DN14089_c0_g1_i1:142-819(-)